MGGGVAAGVPGTDRMPPLPGELRRRPGRRPGHRRQAAGIRPHLGGGGAGGVGGVGGAAGAPARPAAALDLVVGMRRRRELVVLAERPPPRFLPAGRRLPVAVGGLPAGHLPLTAAASCPVLPLERPLVGREARREQARAGPAAAAAAAAAPAAAPAPAAADGPAAALLRQRFVQHRALERPPALAGLRAAAALRS